MRTRVACGDERVLLNSYIFESVVEVLKEWYVNSTCGREDWELYEKWM